MIDINKQYAKTISKFDGNQLISEFKNKNYSKLGPQQKMSLLQELEKRESMDQGRPALDITREPNPKSYGSFYPDGYFNNKNNFKDSVICIDIDKNSYDVLDTYYHENRHAQQRHTILTGKGMDKETALFCKIEQKIRFKDTYDLRTEEIDANTVATKRMLEHKEAFQDDYKYFSYLKDREQHYDEAISQNDQNPSMRMNEIMRKADDARYYEEINSSEYDMIKKGLEQNDRYMNDNHRTRDDVRKGVEQSNKVITEKQLERVPDKATASDSATRKSEEITNIMRNEEYNRPVNARSKEVEDIMKSNADREKLEKSSSNQVQDGQGSGESSKPAQSNSR